MIPPNVVSERIKTSELEEKVRVLSTGIDCLRERIKQVEKQKGIDVLKKQFNVGDIEGFVKYLLKEIESLKTANDILRKKNQEKKDIIVGFDTCLSNPVKKLDTATTNEYLATQISAMRVRMKNDELNNLHAEEDTPLNLTERLQGGSDKQLGKEYRSNNLGDG